MSLITGQRGVSPQRGMPTDDKGASTQTVAVTGETVALKYYTAAGVETADAGQAAGVLVVGKILNDNIRNSLGSAQARYNDTSLTFTSTAATTEVQIPAGFDEFDFNSAADRANAIKEAVLDTNGKYCVDYSSGVIYILKASTQTSLTSTAYTIGYNTTGGGTVVASDVNIKEVGGNTVTTAIPVTFSATVLSTDDSAALEASTVSKAAAGSIYSVSGYNSGAAQFIQIHDAASLPADTAVPEISFKVPAATNFSWTEASGRAMATGIVVCNSSTQATKTIGSADVWFNVTYT